MARPSMFLSIISFFWAYTLTTGDIISFAVICLATGLSLGADMTLLPAVFAKSLIQTKNDANTGFGIWNFSNKLALAVTAGLLLPIMEFVGFETQDMNSSRCIFLHGSGRFWTLPASSQETLGNNDRRELKTDTSRFLQTLIP